MYDIAIIGGGASGLTAAIFAKSANERADVVVIERSDRVAKKLATTGNGQCNITNKCPDTSHYHGDASFTKFAISDFSYKQQCEFFETCGISVFAREDNKAYPFSLQATSVVDGLRFKAAELGVSIICDSRVLSVNKTNGIFKIALENKSLSARSVIIACGGAAGGKLGSEDGYSILKGFGHKIAPLRPSIVQLRSSENFLRALKGVKVPATLSCTHSGHTVTTDISDLLFCDYGISGPAVLTLSSLYDGKSNFRISADVLPEIAAPRSKELLIGRCKNLPRRPCEELLSGLIHKRLGMTLVKLAGIDLKAPIGTLGDNEIDKLNTLIHSLEFNITGTNGMANAQVTAGGAETKDFSNTDMMSKRVSGLFAAGEVLNVDGDCGGYNLCWAWCSGRVAGLGAANYVGDR